LLYFVPVIGVCCSPVTKEDLSLSLCVFRSWRRRRFGSETNDEQTVEESDPEISNAVAVGQTTR
jgi:hypothetical protein